MPLTPEQMVRAKKLAISPATGGLTPEQRIRAGAILNGTPSDEGKAIESFSDIPLDSLMENFASDIGPVVEESLTGLGEAISHPIDTAKAIARIAGGAADINLGTDFVSDETEEMAGAIGRDFKESITDPARVHERPAAALSNLLAFFPTRGAALLASKAGKAGKVASKVAGAADIVDPALIPFNVLRGATGVAKGAGRKAGEAVKKGAESIPSKGKSLVDEGFESTVAFTSGTSGRSVELLKGFAGGDKEEILRATRADPNGAAGSVLTRAFAAVDEVKKKARDEYTDARSNLDPLIKGVPLGEKGLRMKQRLFESLKSEGIEVFRSDEKIVPLPGGRYRIDTGQLRVRGLDTIAENSRGRVAKELEKVLNHDGDIASLDNMKKLLDDEISTFDTGLDATSTSKNARRLIRSARDEVRETLSEVEGYDKAMLDYETTIKFLRDVEDNLGLSGNRIDRVGDVVGNRDSAYRGLAQTLNDDPGARDQFKVLQDLDEMAGNNDIVPSLVGATFAPVFGSGLVVKSQLSQIARGLTGGIIAGSLNPLLYLPVAALFSPRAASELILKFFPPSATAKREKAVGRLQALGRNMEKAGIPIREMARGGMTIGGLIERLEEGTGTDIRNPSPMGLLDVGKRR